MAKLKFSFTISFILLSLQIFSQLNIAWDTIKHPNADWYREIRPNDYQLYQRDLNNSATVSFSGNVVSIPTIESGSVVLRIVKKHASIGNITEVFENGYVNDFLEFDTCYVDFLVIGGSFKFTTSIFCGLINYRFDLKFFRDNIAISDWVKVADSVVCGDVFVVMGQSNAEAESNHDETDLLKLDTTYGNSFCRTFGRPPKFNPVPESHYRFGISRVSRNNNNHPDHRLFNVGVWELYLQGKLSLYFDVPTCILNGGRGGTSIQEHLPQNRPYDIDSLFGNMNYRIYQGGYYNNIKGFIWYQGETDVNKQTTQEAYLNYFRNLHEEIRIHFGQIDKYYIYQIHASDKSGNNINEALRLLPSLYPDMEIMSTNGVGNRVGLHYDSIGYRKIGERLLRLFERDWYCKSDQNIIGIEPPNLKSVYFSENKQYLNIEFTQDVKFDSLPSSKDNRIIESFVINDIPLNSSLVNFILPGENGNSNNRLIVTPIDEDWTNLGTPERISYMIVNSSETSLYLRNSKEVACLSFAINSIPYWGSNTFTENYLNYPYPPYSDFVLYATGRMSGMQISDLKAFEVFNDGATVVPANAKITLKAARKIILSPGFSTEIGSSVNFDVGHNLYAFVRENNCESELDLYQLCDQNQLQNVKTFLTPNLSNDEKSSDISLESMFQIYPIPSIHIEGFNWESKTHLTDVSIELFDQSGRIIQSHYNLTLQSGQIIKLSTRKPGFYIIKSTFVGISDNITFYQKMISN